MGRKRPPPSAGLGNGSRPADGCERPAAAAARRADGREPGSAPRRLHSQGRKVQPLAAIVPTVPRALPPGACGLQRPELRHEHRVPHNQARLAAMVTVARAAITTFRLSDRRLPAMCDCDSRAERLRYWCPISGYFASSGQPRAVHHGLPPAAEEGLVLDRRGIPVRRKSCLVCKNR